MDSRTSFATFPKTVLSSWTARQVKAFPRFSNKGKVQRISASSENNPESFPGNDQNDLDDVLPSSIADWREFRAKLIQEGLRESDTLEEEKIGLSTESTKTWAHPITKPETGCLVIAHPSAFGASQQYFFKSVIFLLWHSEEGSYGIILNKPTVYTLDNVAGFNDLMPEFTGSRLYLGGDVGANTTRILHSYGELEGSDEVVKGVYVGGYKAVKEHVSSGKSKSSDFKWFARYSGWGPGQLEREVASGAWFLGSCSSDLILGNWDGEENVLWSKVMELMGGDYAEMARSSDSK